MSNPATHSSSGAIRGWRLAEALPGLLAMSALMLVGWLGYRFDWRLPRASSLWGNKAEAMPDWCPEHSVPESICVECNADLLPKPAGFGWCAKHGIHECPACHPELAQVEGTPRLPRYDATKALSLLPRPENNKNCKRYERRLQFASDAAAAKAGIETAKVLERPMTDFVSATGEITYDQTKVAHLSSRVTGSVWRVTKALGDAVQAGEMLALVDAADIGKTKNELSNAVVQVRLRARNLARMKALGGVVSERQTLEAEAALEEARIRYLTARQALLNLGLRAPEGLEELDAKDVVARLHFLGIPKELAVGLDPAGTTGNLFPVLAPSTGIVVERDVVPGEVVDATKVLFVVADVRHLWLTLHFRQEDARQLSVGLPVRFQPDGGGSEVAARIDWLSTAVDDKTRTIRARANLVNEDLALRANTFGMGRAILREEPNAVVVPNEAVQWDGDCHVVFVRDKNYQKEGAPKVFHVRQVRVGAKDDRFTELLAGVLPDETVVTKGSGMLRGELLRETFGDACEGGH